MTENVKRNGREKKLFDSSVPRSVLTRALNKLSPAHQKTILLVQFYGYSHAEAAKELGIPLGTVRSRVWLGLRAMRDDLRGQGITAPF